MFPVFGEHTFEPQLRLLEQREAHGLYRAAFDLILGAITVNHVAYIGADEEGFHLDTLAHQHLGHHGTIGAGVFVFRKAQTPALWVLFVFAVFAVLAVFVVLSTAFKPVGQACHFFQDRECTWVA